MCRSIHILRGPDGPAEDDEVRAAALQFVRKVSGYRAPSKANTEAFEAAVAAIAEASRELLDQLVPPPPKPAVAPSPGAPSPGAERKDRAWYRDKARAREAQAHAAGGQHSHPHR
jgi:hypothetical protein